MISILDELYNCPNLTILNFLINRFSTNTSKEAYKLKELLSANCSQLVELNLTYFKLTKLTMLNILSGLQYCTNIIILKIIDNNAYTERIDQALY